MLLRRYHKYNKGKVTRKSSILPDKKVEKVVEPEKQVEKVVEPEKQVNKKSKKGSKSKKPADKKVGE
jgi:hypothetical protein